MITIQKSVGKRGRNQAKDVAKIQLSLFALGHLSQTNFRKELPHANNNLFSPFISFKDKLKDLPKGSNRILDLNLSKTIAAIKKFQKNVVGSSNPDGKVDPGFGTLKMLNRKVKVLPNPETPHSDSNSIDNFKIQKSVGTVGQNQTKDVAKIQLALFALGHLNETNFRNELTNANEDLFSSNISFAKKLKLLPTGARRIADSKISETISAIKDFQKNIVKRRPFDGRVDANGRTFGFIFRGLKKLPPVESTPDSFEIGSTGSRIQTENEVQQVGKNIVIKISAGGKSETKKIPIAESRRFIFNYYNWSGIVKLMDFVFKKNNVTYVRPNNLKGLNEDNILIIPDDGIRYVVQQQLAFAKKKLRPTSQNLKDVLKGVDGKPGKGFLKNIIKKTKEEFTNEIKNKSLKDSNNNTITIPSLKDGEEVLYDFFRKIVIARNGLWSDNQGVTNLVGLRRNFDRMMDTRYNDSLIACWKDESGNPHVEINIATTEPGNKNRHRTVAPQTISTLFGFHKGRQPSGRTRKLLVRSARNGKYKWEYDKGFNFHQGGNTFIFPRNGWLETYGIDVNIKGGDPNGKFNLQQIFDLNLILTEIYYLLSQFGTNGVNAPYQNLKSMAESKSMKIDKLENGIVTISQEGLRTKRKIKLLDAKKWMVGRWYDKRFNDSSREIIAKILSDASGLDEKQMTDMENLNRDEVIAKIKDDWVVKVIKHQFKFYPKLSDIDGKAGPDYYRTLIGIRPSKEEAKKVFPRVKELIKKLEKLPLTKTSSLQKKLRTGLRIHTNLHRENVRNNTRFDETKKMDFIANVLVNGYSAGCQVIYDTETFYDFWLKLLQRAEKSGQRKWYYTLIDATTWKRTDVV